MEVVRDRPVVGQQPGGRDDLLFRHARDPRHDRGRVRRRDRRQPLEHGPAGDLATVGEPGAARAAEGERRGRRVRPARGIVEHQVVAAVDGGHVAERHDRHASQVAAGEQLAGVVAHQQRRVRPLAHERLVEAVVLDQEVDQAERERAVGAGAHLEPQVRLVREPRAPRVDHQQLRAARLRGGDVDAEREKVPGGAGAPEDDAPAARDVGHRQRRRAERVVRGPGVARPLAEVGGAAEVRRPEQVEQPVQPPLGVREAGAAGRPLVERDRLRSRGRAHLEQRPRDQVERLVPGAALPAGVGIGLRARAAHREVDAVPVLVELGRGATLGADGAAERVRPVGLDGDDAVAVDGGDRRAVHAAEAAVARDLSHRYVSTAATTWPCGRC